MNLWQKGCLEFKKAYDLHIKREPRAVAVNKWFRDDGDETLRVNYTLSKESLVLDVGGYKGDWSQAIADKYDPTIRVFEPLPEFCSEIRNRFRSNPKIKVFEFGLAGSDGTSRIARLDDSSSTYRTGADSIEIKLVDVAAFWQREGLRQVDLVKINIEGGEYGLLKRMLDADLVRNCRDIQVQFHDFYPHAKELREELRSALARTHELTYDYYFVWENWRRRSQ